MVQPEVEVLAADSVRVLGPDDTEIAGDPPEVFPDSLNVSESFREQTDPAVNQSVTSAPPQEIAFEGTLRINGYAAGVIRSKTGSLIIDAAGEVDADIFVSYVAIYGCVRGDIHANEKVELGPSARVIGDIETVALSIEPGAVFEGRCIFTHPLSPSEDGNQD